MNERLETRLNSREMMPISAVVRPNILNVTYDYLASDNLRLDPFSSPFHLTVIPITDVALLMLGAFHVVRERRPTRALIEVLKR